MGRAKRAGLEYFPLDTGFFEDKRIRRLTARFGADGPLFYIYVLCKAYSSGYSVEYGDDFAEDAALDLGCSTEKIGLMLHYLLDKSLLDGTLFNAVKVLSSHGIQSQYQAIKKSLKRDVEVDGNSWILNESETEGFIKVRHLEYKSGRNPDKSGRNPDKSGRNDTKEKESKGKEIKEDNDKRAREGINENLSRVMTEYMERIEPTPSPTSMNLLTHYVESLGPEVCLRAIYKAIDVGARKWAYIHTILKNCDKEGIRSLADWDRKEEERKRGKETSTQRPKFGGGKPPKSMAPGQTAQPSSERIHKNSEWLDEFLSSGQAKEEASLP